MIPDITPPHIDKEAFLKAMAESPAVSLKLNRRKCGDIGSLGYGALKRVPWCESGYYLDSRPQFTLNPLLHAGVFYVQDASSMVYETIVSSLQAEGLLGPAPLVLDMCAAPGGKTTSIINGLRDGAFVIANEVMPKRAAILRENLTKWGYPSVKVTNRQTEVYASAGEIFDIVAVDAPCSGEGMMRKDPAAVAQWSPSLVASCAALQRDILANAVKCLLPGGIIIYSTCTFNRTENEENVEWLVRECGMEPIDMKFPEEWGIAPGISTPYPAMRFMPHLTRGEGLFAAVLRKPSGLSSAASPSLQGRLSALEKALGSKSKKQAPRTGEKNQKGKPAPERPDAFLPLRTDYDSSVYPSAELSLEEALRYLRHETLKLPDSVDAGYVVVKYKNYPLGFVKNIGTRANNLYPREWRIRML